MEDAKTTKLLLEFSFVDYALAKRCLEVMERLLPIGTAGDESSLPATNITFDASGWWGSDSLFLWPELAEDSPYADFGNPA